MPLPPAHAPPVDMPISVGPSKASVIVSSLP
jgi:hypothetical protein